MLGTGNPNPNPERSGPAVAIVVGDQPYLIDFGPGVVRRAAAAALGGIEALKINRLNRAFVTHLHSDHTAGFSDLILTPWVIERNEPLQVYGPEGIISMSEHILAAYEQDINMRVFGLEPANNQGYRVEAHEISPGVIYQDSLVTVEAFEVHHGSWPQAFGYRFTTADRVIVISGDATPSPMIEEMCQACDVLIHEVYSDSGFARRSPDWQDYHSQYHTSATELGAMAQRARPGVLLLYHQMWWGSTDETLVEEIAAHFDGTIISTVDLGVY
jgi:ribonuclease Z